MKPPYIPTPEQEARGRAAEAASEDRQRHPIDQAVLSAAHNLLKRPRGRRGGLAITDAHLKATIKRLSR